MKEFIDKLISELKEEHEGFINRYGIVGGNVPASIVKRCMNIVNELAEEYKEECNLDCDKLLFAYSDLLRRFQNAESTVIFEFSGNISKETEELEAECEELLSQFKEILYSANGPQKSAKEYINCSTDISTNKSDTSTISKMENVGWIPCSERLPEEKGDYLVTCNDGKVRVWWFVVEEDFRQWLSGVHQLKPIAWQPLPAPFTEGESR